jgi:copper chaperone CopZ
MNEMTLSVPAMHNDDCVRAISSAVADVAGVKTVAVDLASKTVRVGGDADRAAVCAAIADAGYKVTL